jgi:DNA-binding response OmpR family regulator
MNRKIVVADDDRVTLEILYHILANNSFYVYSARDGQAALELVKKEKPDILISDLVLPKLDGIALCKKVKEDPELSRTRVIMMTAVYKGSTFRPLARDCGADDYIEKPINSTTLLEKIYKLCRETIDQGN